MRDYGRVSPTFWTRGSGKKLRGKPEAQLVALYLFTCPASTMIGIYHLALPTMAHEMGMTVEDAERALAEVCALGIAEYDPEEELLYLPEGARYQIGERLKPGDKRVAGIRNALAQFSRHRFAVAFARRYAADFCLPEVEADNEPSDDAPKVQTENQEGASKDLGSGSYATPKPLGSQARQGSDQVQANTEQSPPNPPQAGELPTEQRTDPPSKAKRSRKTTTATLPGVGSEPADDIFAVFLDAWQKTIGKGAAPVLDEKRRRLVRARLGEGHTVERLKAAACGIFESQWHIDEKQCRFDLVMRDASHVERFATMADEAEPAAPIEKPAWLTQLPPRPRFFLRQCEDAAREQNALRDETTTQQTGIADPFAGLEDGMAEVPS